MFKQQIDSQNFDASLLNIITKFNARLNKLNHKHKAIHNKLIAHHDNDHEHHIQDKYQSLILLNQYKYLKASEKLISFIEYNNLLIKNKNFNDLNNVWEHGDLHIHRTNFFYFEQPKSPLHVLGNIHTTFEYDKITVLMGETGSGKSTLTQILNGLHSATTGYIKNGNFYLFANRNNFFLQRLRTKFGLVFQFPDYQLFANNLQEEILAGPVNLKLVNKTNIDYAKKYMEMVKLPLNLISRSPFQLSAGQKRRLAIASILANQVETLILDEPNVGLDPEGVIWLKDLILKLKNEDKKRIIVVTHDVDFALEIADEIKYLKDGKIVFENDPFTLFNDFELCRKLNIVTPKVIEFQSKIRENNLILKNYKNRTIQDLARSIAEVMDGN